MRRVDEERCETKAVIDLDQNATTPLDPAVAEAMIPWFVAGGNPESRHGLGRRARRALEEARERIAAQLHAEPSELIFTSGGTEANNLAIVGLASLAEETGANDPVVATPIEHPAVAQPLARLADEGRLKLDLRTEWVGRDGVADVEAMAAALTPRTAFTTLILAHNETGVIQPVGRLAQEARKPGVPVHTDAVQAVGRIPVDFAGLGVQTLAFSAHKFHGPAGIGGLLIQRGLTLKPLLFGGGQQRGIRPGTPPVALAVGMAEALERAERQGEARRMRWKAQRDRFEALLRRELGDHAVVRIGPDDPEARLPQTLNLAFPGLKGELILLGLDLEGVAVSLGSACASGAMTPSKTLEAMGLPPEVRHSAVRFSWGAFLDDADLDDAAHRVVQVIRNAREEQ